METETETKSLNLLVDTTESCSQEDIYEMASSLTLTRQPHSRPTSGTSFPSQMDALSTISMPVITQKTKTFRDACHQTGVKDMPGNADIVRLNVMLQRIRTIHQRVLEERAVCMALPDVDKNTVECTETPSTTLGRAVDAVCDAATQTTAEDRHIIVDMELIQSLMETYERYHETMVSDIRDRLAHMEEMANKNTRGTTEEQQQQQNRQPPEVELPSLQPRALTWWRRLLCLSMQTSKSDQSFPN